MKTPFVSREKLAEITAQVMQEDWSAAPKDITDVMRIDESARRRADALIQFILEEKGKRIR